MVLYSWIVKCLTDSNPCLLSFFFFFSLSPKSIRSAGCFLAFIGADAAQIPLDVCIGPCRVLEVTPGIITGEVVENSFPRGCERLLLKSSGRAFIHETAAQAMTYYGCKLVGTDALSIDPDYDETGAAHCAFLRENVVILEGLNLASVHNGEYFLIAPPVKIGEAEAAFVRAVLVSDYIFWSGKSPLA